MKWSRPGRENDTLEDNIIKKYQQTKCVFIFGAGNYGRLTKRTLDALGCNVKFIDNNTEKQKEGYIGSEVYSFERYLKEDGKSIIVVAVSSEKALSIKEQLMKAELNPEYDFFEYDEWVNKVIYVFAECCFNKAYMGLAQICVTERCTLKCKKCAHGCYAVQKDARDLSLEQIKRSADYFFKNVDYVSEFVLIGGEPLLHTELVAALEYIGKTYRSKMGILSITTNGTITPSENLLEVCKQYAVLFRISNYSVQIPRLREKYKKISDILAIKHIEFVLQQEESEWYDYGFETVNREEVPEILIPVFDACKTPCREIRENKLYFCVMARSVSENLGLKLGQEDYLDLEELDKYEFPKKMLAEFNQGYSKKGYLDMCSRCNGTKAKNFLIPAAEQL